MSDKYICPVCRYPDLDDPPENHEICPCCGTHFAYDDCTIAHLQLRTLWVARGMQWWSESTSKPTNWDAIKQLQTRPERADANSTGR